MSKVGLIISREYLTRVKKKSFLLTTLLVPIVIVGFYAAIIAITIRGSDEKKSVAVIDNANLFNGKIENTDNKLSFSLIQNETESSFVKKYKKAGYEAFLYVPPLNIDSPKNLANEKERVMAHREASANNREEALWRLQKVTPIIAILDKPDPPFKVTAPSAMIYGMSGFFVGCVLGILALIAGIIYRYAKHMANQAIFRQPVTDSTISTTI